MSTQTLSKGDLGIALFIAAQPHSPCNCCKVWSQQWLGTYLKANRLPLL